MELGEPYRDNHCEHLKAEIDRVTKELEAAVKKLRELSALKEQLSPELERLRVSELQLLRPCLSLPHMSEVSPFPLLLPRVSCRSLFVQELQY